MHASPVRQRRAGQHDRTRAVWIDRRHHHDLPTGLTVGNDHRLAFRIGMARRNVLDKDRLGATDILDRLSRHRIWQEADEVAGVTGRQRDTDLTILLHPTDAWTVTSARIDDDDRCLRGIDPACPREERCDQSVVHRPLQRAAVAHQFSLELENVRHLLGACSR